MRYYLSSSQSDRINLDEQAARDGYEDARAAGIDAILSGQDLVDHANMLVDLALENETLTDDAEEYRARYVDAYVKAYREEQ